MRGMNCLAHNVGRMFRLVLVVSACGVALTARGAFRVATFEADITLPIRVISSPVTVR